MLLLVLGSADGRNAMFAAMAGEAGCRSNEIAAMAAALPGRGELLSRADPAHSIWMDESGGFAAACRAVPIDRKSVGEGKRVDLGGRRIIKKKKKKDTQDW